MKGPLLFFSILVHLAGWGQAMASALILKGGNSHLPTVLYISGDGGWNSFSTTLLRQLNQKGYPVLGLDARRYFWSRKTPQQAAEAISDLILHSQHPSSNQSFVFIGYSLGADVLPFIEPLLAPSLQQRVKRTILLSPSPTTDFETHLVYGLSGGPQLSVPQGINRLPHPVILVFGSRESDFPLTLLRRKDVQVLTLPGGHHYEGQMEQLVRCLIAQLQ